MANKWEQKEQSALIASPSTLATLTLAVPLLAFPASVVAPRCTRHSQAKTKIESNLDIDRQFDQARRVTTSIPTCTSAAANTEEARLY